MVILKPFKPLYYSGNYENVTSPPFDSISRELESQLKLCDFNITYLTLPGNGPEYGKKLMLNWKRSGKIIKADDDSILIIKQKFQFQDGLMIRYGLIGLVAINPDDGSVKPHEQTFPERVSERVSVLQNIDAQLEPIFIAVNEPDLTNTLIHFTEHADPKFSFTDTESVQNCVYLVSDNKVKELMQMLSKCPAMVADGHHRLEASRSISMKELGNKERFWSSVMAYITDINSESLLIGGIHRVLMDDIDTQQMINFVNQFFGATTMPEGEVSNVIELHIKRKSLFFDASSLKGIDYKFISPVHTLNEIVMKRIHQMNHPRSELEIQYVHDPVLARKRVDSGEASVAFIMPPWNRELLFKLVNDRGVLPQKSTYFYPKVASGIAINQFEDRTDVA